MAQITIQAFGRTSTVEYPDSMVGSATSAFAQEYGWSDTILDEDENEVDNPVSIEDFVLQKVVDFVTGVIQSAQISNAKKEAALRQRELVQEQISQIQVTHA